MPKEYVGQPQLENVYKPTRIEDDLASLPEEALTRDIIIPLLREMDYKNVRYVHGMFEHGVDVICTEETPFGTEFCGLQIKAVPISSAKTSKGGNVAELINQASSALRHRFLDERDNTEKTLDKYFILTSANISDTSAAEIRDVLQQFGRTIRFVDGQALSRYVHEHLHSYVIDYFARRDLVANFGHFLRTPLQGMAGDISLLRFLLSRGVTDNRALLVSNRAESNLLDMSRRIRNFIQVIAPPKTLGITFRQVDVNRLLHAIAHSLATRANERGIRIEIRSERIPSLITDPDALELICANLLDNAVTYSFDNRVVAVDLRSKKNHLLIDIEDFGLHISKMDIPLIWEKGYRGTVATDLKRFGPGTGVGLTVAKRLVEELGGTIEVSCKLVGSSSSLPQESLVRFTVSLPKKSVEEK